MKESTSWFLCVITIVIGIFCIAIISQWHIREDTKMHIENGYQLQVVVGSQTPIYVKIQDEEVKEDASQYNDMVFDESTVFSLDLRLRDADR